MIRDLKPNITRLEAEPTAALDEGIEVNARRQDRRRKVLGSQTMETSDNPENIETSRKDRAILAMLRHGNQEKTAKEVGVHPVTLWRWLQEPAFQRAVRVGRRQAYSDSIGQLQLATKAAVETLLGVMRDERAPSGTRVRAAETVIQQCYKGMAFEELEARVEQLESTASESQTQK